MIFMCNVKKKCNLNFLSLVSQLHTYDTDFLFFVQCSPYHCGLSSPAFSNSCIHKGHTCVDRDLGTIAC